MPAAAHQHGVLYERGGIVDGLRQAVTGILCAALICAILSALAQSGFTKEIIKLLCGLFLTLSVLYPLGQMDIEALAEVSFPYRTQAQEAAAAGEKITQEAMAESIKAQTEAYILDKAEQLKAAVTVDISVSQECIPEFAKISGDISPDTRKALEAVMETDLGITKENQLWTGQQAEDTDWN